MKSTFSNNTTKELDHANDEGNRSQLLPDVEGKQQASQISYRIDAGTIFVVLPAYNEAQGLPSLLKKIQLVFAANGRDYHVIVVDDASTDDTAEIASKATFQMPLTLVRHKVNQNLPGALRSGFIEATRLAVDGDVIVTMDGDDTHQPGSINRLLQMIEDGYDVATCSRFQPGSRVCGVPPLRVFMAFGARMMFKTIMPIPGVRDYTCGYRAYRAKHIETCHGILWRRICLGSRILMHGRCAAEDASIRICPLAKSQCFCATTRNWAEAKWLSPTRQSCR